MNQTLTASRLQRVPKPTYQSKVQLTTAAAGFIPYWAIPFLLSGSTASIHKSEYILAILGVHHFHKTLINKLQLQKHSWISFSSIFSSLSWVLAPQQVSRFLLFVRSHCSETIQYACSKLDQLCALQCHHNNLDHVLSYRTQSEDTYKNGSRRVCVTQKRVSPIVFFLADKPCTLNNVDAK